MSEILADPTLFADVPDDWQVILSDVRGSTQALNDGRHQVVNLVATGSIIAALNIAHRAGVLARVDRLLMMRDGVVQLEGPREEVLEKMRATAGRPGAPASQPMPQQQPQAQRQPAQGPDQTMARQQQIKPPPSAAQPGPNRPRRTQ